MLPYLRDQTPSQRIGDWLSMRFIEPVFAFYDPDYALSTVVRRQPWPDRPGLPSRLSVRKLALHDEDRNTQMWDKVETDPDYRALARRVWAQDFDVRKLGETKADPGEAQKAIDEAITKAVAAIATLRARGVRVLFVRAPSAGEYYAYEQRAFPRAKTWDPLLAATQTPGIHFEDYPELQGYDLPEWSHLSASEAERYTATLVPIVEREVRRDGSETSDSLSLQILPRISSMPTARFHIVCATTTSSMPLHVEPDYAGEQRDRRHETGERSRRSRPSAGAFDRAKQRDRPEHDRGRHRDDAELRERLVAGHASRAEIDERRGIGRARVVDAEDRRR